jgi:hypothetical protein
LRIPSKVIVSRLAGFDLPLGNFASFHIRMVVDRLWWMIQFSLHRDIKTVESPVIYLSEQKAREKRASMRTTLNNFGIGLLCLATLTVFGWYGNSISFSDMKNIGIGLGVISILFLVYYAIGKRRIEAPIVHEKDIFKPEHTEFLELHQQFLIKGQPEDYQIQVINEHEQRRRAIDVNGNPIFQIPKI